jgi:hypothetical protein
MWGLAARLAGGFKDQIVKNNGCRCLKLTSIVKMCKARDGMPVGEPGPMDPPHAHKLYDLIESVL